MFKGSIVALVTPMLSNGDVDFSQLEALIEFHVDQGTQALVIAGTTGESATLSPVEHCDLLNKSYEMIKQRLPMIAGTGANSTAEAIELTRCAGDSLCENPRIGINEDTHDRFSTHSTACTIFCAASAIVSAVTI